MSKKETVVFTSGSWDLFHVGHLNMLRRSRALGDRLIVGVSTDELIEDYKGAKPVIPYEQRLAIVASIRYVDGVVKQTVLTEIAQLKRLKVDVVTIGDDWRHKHLDGLEWMKRHGRVMYLRYTDGISTTGIKKKIVQNAYQIIDAALQRETRAGDEWARQRTPALPGTAEEKHRR